MKICSKTMQSRMKENKLWSIVDLTSSFWGLHWSRKFVIQNTFNKTKKTVSSTIFICCNQQFLYIYCLCLFLYIYPYPSPSFTPLITTSLLYSDIRIFPFFYFSLFVNLLILFSSIFPVINACPSSCCWSLFCPVFWTGNFSLFSQHQQYSTKSGKKRWYYLYYTFHSKSPYNFHLFCHNFFCGSSFSSRLKLCLFQLWSNSSSSSIKWNGKEYRQFVDISFCLMLALHFDDYE